MKIAEPTVERLVQYHRLLETLRSEGHTLISSSQIGETLGLKASQVRKDLSYFGEIGRRGVGYSVGKLSDHIMGILSSPCVWRVALAGVGNLGAAILANASFRSAKMSFEALFDVDASKVGREIMGVRCWHIDDMPRVMRELSIEVLIVAVPAGGAQQCVDLAVQSGTLRGVLALTQGTLALPDGVIAVRADIMAEMEKLLFFLKHPEDGEDRSGGGSV